MFNYKRAILSSALFCVSLFLAQQVTVIVKCEMRSLLCPLSYVRRPSPDINSVCCLVDELYALDEEAIENAD